MARSNNFKINYPLDPTPEQKAQWAVESEAFQLDSDKRMLALALKRVSSTTPNAERMAILVAAKERHLKWIEERLDRAIMSLAES